jgi:hypothetical protein
MNSSIRVTLAIGCFALVVAHAGEQAEAAVAFHDSFVDGDHTDGTPVLWSPGTEATGDRSVVNGRLVHTPFGAQNMSTYAEECLGNATCDYGDVSLRSAFRVGGAMPRYATLFARSTADATLFGGIDSSARAVLAMSLGTEVTFFTRVSTEVDPLSDDVNLQLDVQGDQMSLWMWTAGNARPEMPTATATIPDSFPNDTATVGFFYNPADSDFVSFDFFEATPIPEPSTLTMGFAVLLGVFSSRRRGLWRTEYR